MGPEAHVRPVCSVGGGSEIVKPCSELHACGATLPTQPVCCTVGAAIEPDLGHSLCLLAWRGLEPECRRRASVVEPALTVLLVLRSVCDCSQLAYDSFETISRSMSAEV